MQSEEKYEKENSNTKKSGEKSEKTNKGKEINREGDLRENEKTRNRK